MMSNSNYFISTEVIDALGLTIIDSIWQGIIIAILLFVLLSFVKINASDLRYKLSIAALLAMFVCSIISFVGHYEELSRLNNDNYSGLGNWIDQWALAEWSDKTLENDRNTGLFSKVQSYLYQHTNKIAFAWGLGVIFLFLRFIGAMTYVTKLRNTGISINDELIREKLVGLTHKLGIKGTPALIESAMVKAPLTIGYLKPIIILPIGMLTGIPVAQLESLLIHELVHIKKADYFVNLIQSFVEILFFYHPATWYISDVIGKEREHRCDAITLKLMENPLPYAMALTSIYEKGNHYKPRLAMSAQPQKGEFTMRIFRIMNIGEPKPYKNRLLAMLLVMIFSAGLIAFKAPEPKDNLVKSATIENVMQQQDKNTPKDQKIVLLEQALNQVKSANSENAAIPLAQKEALRKKSTKEKASAEEPLEKESAMVDNVKKIEKQLKDIKNLQKKGNSKAIQTPSTPRLKADTNKTTVVKIRPNADESATPLYILDGKPVEKVALNENLKPDQILSINVLKGAKATDQFGEKAKDGVIIIYTKGYKGEKIKIESKPKEKAKIKASKAEKKLKFTAKDSVRIDVKSGLIKLYGDPKLSDEKNEINGVPLFQGKDKPLHSVKMSTFGLGDEGKQPLLIVDGKEWETTFKEFTDQYESKDINSIFVYKKSEDTIEKYGEKAKYGVLMINTKSGQANKRLISDIDHDGDVYIYPNPSKNNVKIMLEVEKKSKVEIKAYNLSGKLVDNIVESSFDAGKHTINWEADKLPKGSYIIHINLDGKKFKRNVLLKE